MRAVTEELLEEIADAIVRKVSPVRIVLFGSHAKKNGQPDSDVDLLVVEEGPFGPGHTRHQEFCRIQKALWGIEIPIDVLVCTLDDVDKWRSSRYHIIGEIARQGRVLYEQS